jgi:hypothetical protein
VIVLLLYQRIDIAVAERQGASVAGDRAAVGRLLAQLEKP